MNDTISSVLPPQPVPPKKRYDFDATTGLRGVCCLLVIAGNFTHFFSAIPSDPEQYHHHVFDYHSPVSMFFIMSGVLLASLYGHKLEARTWAPVNRSFWRKRAARLVPLYYLALALNLPAWLGADAPFGDSSDGERWPAPVASLTMTRSFFPVAFLLGDYAGVGQVYYVPSLWTISAFMLCYMFTPCLLSCCKAGEPEGPTETGGCCDGPCGAASQKGWLLFGYVLISLIVFADAVSLTGLMHMSGLARCFGPFAAGLYAGV